MSEQTSQEPTMEEILASIRRIISEDDAPAADAPAATSAMVISFFSIAGVFSSGFFRREVEKMMGQERRLQ